MADMLRWSQLAIDIADGDPVKGILHHGSPLAHSIVFRGYSRAFLGIPGWRNDFRRSRGDRPSARSLAFASVVAYRYAAAFVGGVIVLDDVVAFGEMEEAFQVAVDLGDHNGLDS